MDFNINSELFNLILYKLLDIFSPVILIIMILGLPILNFYILFSKKDKNRIKELESLPIGINVIHDPNPVMALKGNNINYKFIWQCKTIVKAMEENLTIVEFGTFRWSNEDQEWCFTNYTGAPFTKFNFEDWYSCSKGILKKGIEYSDPNNWSGEDVLIQGKIKWYYVGKNSKGNKFKGESIVYELPELVQG